MSGFLQDGKGDNSSMRLGALIWVVGVFVIWAIVSLLRGEMVDIPGTVGGILAGLMTAKVFQSHIETKEKQNE